MLFRQLGHLDPVLQYEKCLTDAFQFDKIKARFLVLLLLFSSQPMFKIHSNGLNREVTAMIFFPYRHCVFNCNLLRHWEQ